jgi:hypothetical protein
VTYKYDALGRRIQRTPSSGISTNFVYDGQDVVKDINSDGSTVEYLHGPGVDNKIRQKGSSTSTTYYFSQDHLGSTTALTGPSRTEMFCISSSKICRLSRWPTVSALRYLEQLEPKRLLNYGATMYLDNIGEIIARRELHVGNPTEPQRKVQVLIGKPVAFPDSGGYYCPFQIVGVGAEQIKYAAGVDAIQSLQLVMLMLGATLQFLNEGLNGTLRWEGSSEGEFGFPTSE